VKRRLALQSIFAVSFNRLLQSACNITGVANISFAKHMKWSKCDSSSNA